MIDIINSIYNAKNYLSTALNSIASQTLKDKCKIILVDDASTDNYDDIIKKYNMLDIKYIYLRKNKGPGNARNIGIKNSSSPYIIFLDADDFFTKNNSLELLINNISKNKMVIANEFLYDKVAIHYGNLHAKLYLREVIEKNKIKFPKIYYGEDTIFNIKYILSIKENEIKQIDDIIYKWRKVNLKSLSSNYNNLENYLILLNKSKKYIMNTSNTTYKFVYISYYMKSLNTLYCKIRDLDEKYLFLKSVKKYYKLYEKDIIKYEFLKDIKLINDLGENI